MPDEACACSRRRLLRTAAAVVAVGNGRGSAAQDDPTLVRQAAAWRSAVLVAPDGRVTSISTTRKPVTFINLWAYWCAPCIAELGSIARMVDVVGPSAVEVMLVSLPPNWSQDRNFAAQHRLPFGVWTFAPTMKLQEIQAAVRDDGVKIEGIPQTIVFSGPRRRLRLFSLGGRDWASPANVSTLEAIVRDPD